MIKKFKIITPIIFFLLCATIKAQDKSSHEIGIVAGAASLMTDYGQRFDFRSGTGGNVGPGAGLVYYLTFTDYRYRWDQRTNYFQEHFRIRFEFSYMKSDLEHYGKWPNATYTSGPRAGQLTEGALKLRAHHGNTAVTNLGAMLEFHIVDIVDFGTRHYTDLKWSPYASFGAFANHYNPKIWSDKGDWRDPRILYPKWDINTWPGVTTEKAGFAMSIAAAIGTRHKLGEYSDILIESRWQYFLTDYIEGMDAKQAPENKFNDWLLFLHIGYVYYLN